MSKLQKTPSALKREQQAAALQNIKFHAFFSSFMGHFAHLDPDPDSEYRSGSTDLNESGVNPDPDPRPGAKEAN